MSNFANGVTPLVNGLPVDGSNPLVASGSTSVRQSNKSVTARYPITLDVAGAVRDLGTLTMLVTAYSGTSATRCVFNWREIR